MPGKPKPLANFEEKAALLKIFVQQAEEERKKRKEEKETKNPPKRNNMSLPAKIVIGRDYDRESILRYMRLYGLTYQEAQAARQITKDNKKKKEWKTLFSEKYEKKKKE